MMNLTEIELLRYLNQYALQQNLLKVHNVRVSYLAKRHELAEDISDLRNGMEQYNEPVPNKDQAIDRTVQRRLMRDYGKCFANEAVDISRSTAMIPGCNWLMDKELLDQANALFDKLRDTL